METLEQIVAKMAKKPDVNLLVEWVDERVEQWADEAMTGADRRNEDSVSTLWEIRDALTAYFDALEG